MSVPEYPEHAKLAKVSDQTQAVHDFMTWLHEEHGVVLAVYDENDDGIHPTRLHLAGVDMHTAIADFFDIDMTLIEREKRAMLMRTNGE